MFYIPPLPELLISRAEETGIEIIENWKDFKQPGLMNGRSGMILLLASLSELFPEKEYARISRSYLNDIAVSLENDELSHYFSTGVAGIAFVIQYLRNKKFIEAADGFDLSEIDGYISLTADRDLQMCNWDPLHGLIGSGIYFLERNKETGETVYLEKICDYLHQLQMDWCSDRTNFGMAHGLPAVLSFLAQVYSKGIRKQQINEMTGSGLSFLLKHELKNDPLYSFPSSPDIQYSRLAWCYGDLCVANSLVHCGKAFARNDYYQKGIDIALKTTNRSFEQSGCIDASFCHGSIGLVHQYHRFYRLTGNENFLRAGRQWSEWTTEKFYKSGEGAGGYYFQHYNEKTENFESIAQYNLLEGSAGIALVDLFVMSNMDMSWDIIFQTNV